jgi:hypothetical protein
MRVVGRGARTKVLVQLADQAHMWSMSGRPCNPGNDLQRLWQIFLRDTPMPQCGAPPVQPTENSTAVIANPATAEPAANPTRDR